MTDHGLRHGVHPIRRLGALGRHYPWSILWVMFTAGIAALSAGAYVAVFIILILSCIIGLHSTYLEHSAEKDREGSE